MEAIEVVKDSDAITKNIVAMVKCESQSSAEPTSINSGVSMQATPSTNVVNHSSPKQVVTKEEKAIVDDIKAPTYLWCLMYRDPCKILIMPGMFIVLPRK